MSLQNIAEKHGGVPIHRKKQQVNQELSWGNILRRSADLSCNSGLLSLAIDSKSSHTLEVVCCDRADNLPCSAKYVYKVEN